MRNNYKTLSSVAAIFALCMFAGCAELNDPNFGTGGGGYYNPPPRYDGYGRDDDYYRRHRYDRDDHYREREEERERERERERRERDERQHRHDDDRDRDNRHPVYRVPPPPPARVDHCPSGFQQSENKCSPEERKRGCKDIRTPSGLGCVRR